MAHPSRGSRISPLKATPSDQIRKVYSVVSSFSASGGILLILVTVAAMLIANSGLGEAYHRIFHESTITLAVPPAPLPDDAVGAASLPGETTSGHVASPSSLVDGEPKSKGESGQSKGHDTAGGWREKMNLLHVINDLLMAVFFFFVGLEIKREVLYGELSSLRRAALPLFGALGGMAMPGLLFAAINWGGPGLKGWGIPTATDIAFALGIMALLGSRVPVGLKVFLTTLAVADDLGALLIIAVFYTEGADLTSLAMGFAALAVMMGMNRIGVRAPVAYLILGGVVWYFIHHSGVHATIAGVMTAMTIPSTSRVNLRGFALFTRQSADQLESLATEDSKVLNNAQQDTIAGIEDACERVQSPLHRLEHSLQPIIAFLIVPLFAFANAGVPVAASSLHLDVTSREFLGVLAGLLIGKPLGIFGAAFLCGKMGWGTLPTGVTWGQVHGAAWLGGVGFTMSLFIANLAFADPGSTQINPAKLGILTGSAIAAVIGLVVLSAATKQRPRQDNAL